MTKVKRQDDDTLLSVKNSAAPNSRLWQHHSSPGKQESVNLKKQLETVVKDYQARGMSLLNAKRA